MTGDFFGLEVSEAKLSKCGLYRYTLQRSWDARKRHAVFVMLNPSTADADTDDPTVRRCTGFAEAWGMGGFLAVNLFAYRTSNPKYLWSAPDPIGPEWEKHIRELVGAWGVPYTWLAAWGADRRADFQAARFCGIVKEFRGTELHCLKLTKSGRPYHPLYVPKDCEPKPFDLSRYV